jgi:hypothetical protein
VHDEVVAYAQGAGLAPDMAVVEVLWNYNVIHAPESASESRSRFESTW